MTAAIEFKEVAFAYRQRQVLEGLSFSISPHETVCFVGPNGGGKSTALKLMLGLLSPQKGSVRILGKAPRRAQRRIGYMPQSLEFDPLFPLTVKDVVLAGRLNGMRPGFYSRNDRLIAAGCLDEMELSGVAEHPMAELSGGQRQRGLIARALAVEPEILLLDEPTAMVDAHLETRLLEKIRSLHRQLTIVLVSHDAAFVSSLVERVFCVNTTVTEHAAEGLTAETMHALYGDAVQVVRHDHDCAHDHGEGGHE
jgi:zinc transport system ATP-binding protein|tara:strand:+ start:97 stop:855 length:759 start_codon:yes stop_codon:yes gene_type:complete